MKAGRIIVIAASVAVLVGAAFYGNRYMTCRGLEQDYLNSVSAMKNASTAMPILKENADAAAMSAIREMDLKRAETAMRSLHEQCGTRAAQTAARQGSEMLLP